MAWLIAGSSRIGPGGGGTMLALCLVIIVCFIWRLGLVSEVLLRWLWLGWVGR